MITPLGYLLAYLVVCVVGHFVVAVLLYGMRRVTLNRRPEFWDWSVFFIGATERAVALTLVLLAPPYLPPFIGGWVALKFALGWQRERKTKEALTGSMLALIGNVLSFTIAIGVGVYLNRHAIDVWATVR
jgi:hypothetical protein